MVNSKPWIAFHFFFWNLLFFLPLLHSNWNCWFNRCNFFVYSFGRRHKHCIDLKWLISFWQLIWVNWVLQNYQNTMFCAVIAIGLIKIYIDRSVENGRQLNKINEVRAFVCVCETSFSTQKAQPFAVHCINCRLWLWAGWPLLATLFCVYIVDNMPENTYIIMYERLCGELK